MPSGAKKKKRAARRKGKEELTEQGLAHPPGDNPVASSDKDRDAKEKSSSSSSSSSSDEEEQKGGKESLATEVAQVEEVPVPVSAEVEAVSVESVDVDKSGVDLEESSAVTLASVVPTDAPVPLEEETIEAAEAAAETMETSLEIHSLSHEVETKSVPILEETPVSMELPRVSGELPPDSMVLENMSSGAVDHRLDSIVEQVILKQPSKLNSRNQFPSSPKPQQAVVEIGNTKLNGSISGHRSDAIDWRDLGLLALGQKQGSNRPNQRHEEEGKLRPTSKDQT
ncbi:hypothetical protein ZIOFF_047508 [Zingiber officinale]|uniref:Uncharacterized protein n=1 Tax=Zingiber officinale TaxID=94328 RepID=A0A8J5KTR0_ZINOF|nr:hypothetical protein ZIOFF_047508 [Zingiber officinale]